MIFFGLGLALQLWFTKKINRAANRFLALALITVVLWMIWLLGANMGLTTHFPRRSWLPLRYLLVLGPLIYFYILKITRPEFKLNKKDLLHFSPLLLQLGLWVLANIDSASYNISIFSGLTPFLQLFTFISIGSYLYASNKLIERFYGLMRFNEASDRYRHELKWIQRLLAGFGFSWLVWMFYTLADYLSGHKLPADASYPVYLLVAIMMIWMAASALARPDIGVLEPVAPFKPLLPADLKQKGIWLKEVMKANLYYQDAELTLRLLAETLGMQPNDLSRIINQVLKKSFNDFINEYRVAEVIEKMHDPEYDKLTLIGIAMDSGFNSKSSFNRIFKDMTGKSPAEYKSWLKERPKYTLRPFSRTVAIISGQETTPLWSSGKLNRNYMFKNYLKIAWRNLLRQRLFSLINISGLAVGLSVCMLIMIYVAHEHSYDRFHKNADRIVKPYGQIKMNGNTFGIDQMSYVSGPIIKQSLPVVADYMRVTHYFTSSTLVSNPSQPEQKFVENKLLFADAGFFNFFSFKLLSGQPAQVLSKPFSVVISKDMAKKYFGDENPVGKTLTIKTDSAYTYQVTGVAENCPSNSSIEYNFVASNSGFVTTKAAKDYLGEQKLGGGTFDVYLLLKHRSDTAALTRGLRTLMVNKDHQAEVVFSLLPIADQHLKRSRDDANIKYLTIFPLVALLILLLALVNYMSLSTARATLRAKEIGVRKISGASRKSVALQFYIESALFATISFVLGYILCYLFKPVFFNVLQLKIDDSFFFSPPVLALLVGLLVVIIVVSGSYPSIVLSAFKPVVTLKGKMGKRSGGVIIRKIFTILQFSISVALIICGIVIDRQLYFFRHTNIGVDRDNVVMIPVSGTFKNYQSFNHDIKTLAGVSAVSTSRYSLFSYIDMYGIAGKTKDETVMLSSIAVDQDFFKLVGLKWKYPPLTHDNLAAGHRVVINELAIEKLHLPANPVGEPIGTGSKDIVAGVVKNFNFGSLEDPIQPLGLWVMPDTAKFWKTQGGCFLFAKVKPRTNLPTLLGAMQKVFKKYDSETPFDYSFMDDAFNARYKAEDRLASIFSIFTIITIMLAGMGLFGLAAFTIEQRTKEIGIRKVLGASVSSINSLLSKDFLKLVLLSIVIASPAAWYAMHGWLQGFAYRINVQWWMFAGAGALAVIVAVITISYHSIKAAIVNPVESLRSE